MNSKKHNKHKLPFFLANGGLNKYLFLNFLISIEEIISESNFDMKKRLKVSKMIFDFNKNHSDILYDIEGYFLKKALENFSDDLKNKSIGDEELKEKYLLSSNEDNNWLRL